MSNQDKTFKNRKNDLWLKICLNERERWNMYYKKCIKNKIIIKAMEMLVCE